MRIATTLLAVFAIAAPSAAAAQEQISVDELKQLFETRYKEEQVRIRGWVSAERRVESASFRGFYLQDRFGALILVRTTNALPAIRAELIVTGVAIMDADRREIYIAETGRRDVTPRGPSRAELEAASRERDIAQLKTLVLQAIQAHDWTAASNGLNSIAELRADDLDLPTWRQQVEVGLEIDRRVAELRIEIPELIDAADWEQAGARVEELLSLAPGSADALGWAASIDAFMAEEARAAANRRMLIYGGMGLAAILLAATGTWLIRASKAAPPAAVATGSPATKSVTSSTADRPLVAAPEGIDDYKTVKVYKTTKVMPATLTVLDGEAETDVIHLYDHTGTGEVELGRESPEANSGIRIKDKTNTVSRRQATIQYLSSSKTFWLTNLAGLTSNPTVLNGRELGENESAELSDGDTVIFGALKARFRTK